MDWKHALEALSKISPATYCQSFFLLASAGVLGVAILPDDLKTLMMDYGARKSSSTSTTPPSSSSSSSSSSQENILLTIINSLTTLTQVPHSWFGLFYLLSVGLSLFWLAQFFFSGSLLRFIASTQSEATSTTILQVAVGWTMMFLQGTRRVYEHAVIIKPSSTSTMWVVHWLLGLFFYLAISVSIWVEGSGAIMNKTATTAQTELIKIMVAVPAFLFAWVNQYKCHKHLAGLKKYSLPTEGMFRWFVCPHYTCECLLYLSMAVATAPKGTVVNQTLLSAVVFVAVNLGVTAAGTRKWYAAKFGSERIAGRWNMIPFVF
ncbi:hypothetical protein QBC35DRAFT_378764 [Podospora australis]|uniref:Polyprenal reductase n=1 Tax=Podospora australis TaxID=1536484 RepID=A0AAN6WY59_9PEZI|nr:hypothetical protein QBC35DRAFT_378764 [Podospora australis]